MRKRIAYEFEPLTKEIGPAGFISQLHVIIGGGGVVD